MEIGYGDWFMTGCRCETTIGILNTEARVVKVTTSESRQCY